MVYNYRHMLYYRQTILFYFFLLSLSAFGQYPSAPNETDANGLRIGRWTILLTRDFKPTTVKDSMRYFRVITYNKGVPSGRVYDYYISGALQADISLISDQPEDVYDGKAIAYYEKGNIKYLLHFDKGTLVGQHQEYSPNGVLLFTGQYTNGKANGYWEYFYESGELKVGLNYKDGLLNGPKIMYSKDGKIIEKGQLLNDKKVGYWESWFDNGIKEYEGSLIDGKREGKWTFYFDNGNVQSTGNYSNNMQNGEWTFYYENGKRRSFGTKKDGLGEGKWTYFHETGEYKSSGMRKSDLSEGEWIYYFPGGQLEEIDTFVDDTLDGPYTAYHASGGTKEKGQYKKGNKDGFWQYYHENGKLRMTNSYTNGLGQGYRDSYSEDGILIEKIFFDKDSMMGPYSQYYNDGTIEAKGSLVNDKRDGWCEKYYPDGTLKEKALLHNAIFDGPYEAYHPNGNLKSKGAYKDNLLSGPWENFFANKQLSSKGAYLNDKLDGYWEWYFENGQLDGKGNTKDGFLNGYWEEFYSSGQLKQKGIYGDSANKEGRWVFYQQNGNIDREGMYKNGWRTGTWNYYNSDGSLSCRGKMNHEASGPWMYYDSLGKTKTMVIEFKRGLRNGKKTIYTNNKIDTVFIFKNDKLITLSTLKDSADNEILQHHFKEAEDLILQTKKIETERYPETSVYRYNHLRRYSNLYSAQGDYDQSKSYNLKYLASIKKYHLDTTLDYAYVLNDLANNYSSLKRYDEAIPLYKQSLEIVSSKTKLNDYNDYVTIFNISRAYEGQGKIDSSLITLLNYRDKVKKAYGESDSSYYQTLKNIALIYYDQVDYKKANEIYFYLNALLEKQNKTSTREYRSNLSNIANVYLERHLNDSAIYYARKSVNLYLSAHDTLSSYYFYSLERIANYYTNIGKADSALIINSSIIEKMNVNPYIDFYLYKISLYSIALHYYEVEQYEESLKRFLALKAIYERDEVHNTLIYGHTLQSIAYIYVRLYTDKTLEATRLFETSVQIKKGTFGEDSPNYLHAASDLSRFYSTVNNFEKAIAQGQELLGRIEKILGKDHFLYAHHSEVLGNIFSNYSDNKQALPYYQNAYTIYAANKQNEFIEYVNISSELALCLELLYREEEAEKIYLRTLQEIETTLGKENIHYIRLEKKLILLFTENGRDDAAKVRLKEIIPIAKKVTGEKGEYYFGYLNTLAKVELELGEFNKSDSLLTMMKNISLKYHGASSDDYLIYLKEKANLEKEKRNYKEADLYYIQALKLTAHLHGTSSEEYARQLRRNAVFHRSIKRYTESIEFLLKAKNNIEAIYGNKLVVYGHYILDLAKSYDYKGEYDKAEKYYDEAIAIYERENGVKNWNYVNSQKDKAQMYMSEGLYSKAKETYELYMKAVEMYVGKDGHYASALSEIASIYRHSGLYPKAIEYQKQSQKLLDSIYSFQDYRYIIGFNTLGLIYLEAHQVDSADYYFTSYKKSVDKLFPDDSVAYSTYYNNYSRVCHQKGNYETSEKLLNATYKIEKESINSDPTFYINFYDNYAELYTSWGKLDKAEKYWKDVLSAVLNYTNKMFEGFSEQEKTQFWSKYSQDFEIYNSYCLLHRKTKPTVLQGMYDNRIATKAIVLNSINKLRKRIYNSRDTSLIKKYENWQVLKDRTASYYGVSPKELKEAGISIDSMEKVLERWEKDLNISVEDKKQMKASAVSWKDIQKKIQPGEAAVEIIRFRNYTTYLTDSVVYAALILTENTKDNPELVILPYGNKLENRYLNFYKNAIKFKSADSLSYKAFWQPLEENLKGINTLYISLDGVYNQININTLMLPDGSYLLDKRKTIIVSNTKDVLTLKSNTQLSKNNSSQSTHLFGFPDYDAGMDQLPAGTGNERDINVNMDFASKNSITKLPGTKVEMEKIVALLADKQWRFRSYLNDQATEDFVKALQSPLVLHIATHGFFLGEEQVKLGTGENGYMNGQKYNPLLMSGLMLTGATKSLLGYSSKEGENGILTALEASTLNLDNTELVILSACETGKGEIKVGEGVYGLQRAFQVAGSKATIMSLWKVDDNATQQLMESFYRNWMDSGNKTEAFRKAQLEVRKKYTSPYYWGAFVMMGQ